MRILPTAVACAVMIGSVALADIVALKRSTGIVVGGNLDAVFTSAISGGTIAVKAGTIQDAALLSQTYSSWKNYGATILSSGAVATLIHFDFTELDGFQGGTINRAEFRIVQGNGNTGTRNVGRIKTHAWIEGALDAVYPGAAGGVSHAHPVGYNTTYNRNASGGTSQPWMSWGNGTQFFDPANDGTDPRGYKGTVGGGNVFVVFDVTDIVTLWASGTANLGFYMPASGNYTFRLSEHTTTDHHPVLFLDYTPKTASGTVVFVK